MSNKAAQNNTVVDTLSTILKQVRIFGYGAEELDPALDLVLDSSQQPKPPVTPSLATHLASYKLIPYQNADISNASTDYNNSINSSLNFNDSLNYPTNYSNSVSSSNYSSSSASVSYTNSLNSSSDYTSSVPLYESISEGFPYEYENEFDEKTDVEDVEGQSARSATNNNHEEDSPKLPQHSLNEVAQHDMQHDCWMVLYDKVYDVTQFLYEHPGGEDLLMEHAGRDGTIAFRGVGHSKAALASLSQYLIGELPEPERIFTSWENH